MCAKSAGKRARGTYSMIMKFVARLSSVLALLARVVLALRLTEAVLRAKLRGSCVPTYEAATGKINAWTVAPPPA